LEEAKDVLSERIEDLRMEIKKCEYTVSEMKSKMGLELENSKSSLYTVEN